MEESFKNKHKNNKVLILEFTNTKRICYPKSSIVNHRENEFVSMFCFSIFMI